jgi:hypothetical protein
MMAALIDLGACFARQTQAQTHDTHTQTRKEQNNQSYYFTITYIVA